MKVDLFTFIAQIINFIILVVLLYYFLFKKVIRSIDDREEKIRNEFSEAEEREEKAQKTIEEHEKQLGQLHAQKEHLINEAKKQASEEKQRLLDEARASAAEKKDQWIQKLEREKIDFLNSLQEKIAEEVYTIAEAVVADLSNANLQAMIYTRFLEVIDTLPQEQIDSLRAVYSEAKAKEVTILSSFELRVEEKEEVEQILVRILDAQPTVIYRTNSVQLLGISLQIGGFELNWTARNYFDKLEEKFEKVLAGKNA